MANACSLIFLILITLLCKTLPESSPSFHPPPHGRQGTNTQHPTVPPVGVALVAGCGADVLINLGLTLLGYIPGHLHAFYILYVYYSRQDAPAASSYERAPGIYSERVQTGGHKLSPAHDVPQGHYGTMN